MTWISVEDRLPEDGQWVWGGGIRSPNPLHFHDGRFLTFVRGVYVVVADVTEWQPLPEAPKPEEYETCRNPQKFEVEINDCPICEFNDAHLGPCPNAAKRKESATYSICGGCGHVSDSRSAALEHDCAGEVCRCVSCVNRRKEPKPSSENASPSALADRGNSLLPPTPLCGQMDCCEDSHWFAEPRHTCEDFAVLGYCGHKHQYAEC